MYALWVHARDINNKAQADAVIAQAKATGMTDILFQLLDDNGRAHYNPTPPFQKCTSVGAFDPLAYLASSSLRTHAWLCVGTDIPFAHPEWNVRTTQELPTTYPSWADFTRADVRQFAADWCSAIAKAYPTVGIHLDYMRWHTDFGDAKLAFAKPEPITETVKQIAAAIPTTTPLTAAVSSNPEGGTSGSWQVWGDWMGILDYAVIMAYPANLPDLQTMMARSAAYSKSQIAVGLSGLDFQYNPYRETRLAPSILADCVNWARSAGYTHFAWFDYAKIDAEQYATIAQLSSAGGIVEPALLPASPLTLFAVLFFALAVWRFRACQERERPIG